ncbi:MAG: hypothetical protein A3G94_01975 [Deltaproteobacteria bacterium RIFCSPLOWO2_12_FULL_60_16]|nr:MAG: hypothetical protein A3G94_01975 [Deltaproteobacteria bacterium RIFCSPLOWO2_12_FULL_60_16]
MRILSARGLTSLAESNRVAREAASPAQSNGFARDLTCSPKAIGAARGPASRAQSNSSVGSLNLHDWCFGLAQQAPSLYGATEGSASEAADVETKRFG